MTHFDLSMTSQTIIVAGVVQGFGMGFLMVPLSAAAFATLPASLRAEGSGLVSITRSVGQGVGISLMQALLVRNTQQMHDSLAGRIASGDPVVAPALPTGAPDVAASTALALNAEITRQATMIAYVDDYKLMLWIVVICVPMVLLMGGTRRASGGGHVDAR
jgi:DHA2 family multidrug resistance protein